MKLINKDALVAEIERRRDYNAKEFYPGRLFEDNYFLDFLDTLEVKEVQEEPVNEDLDEAADVALSNVLNTHEIINIRSCLEMFKYGAKWQKEQMMAKAIDGIARPYDNEIWCTLDSFNLKDGNKVKVIVIKED